MKTNHTPGPWVPTLCDREVTVVSPKRMVAGVYRCADPAETAANTAVLAAAPELLEACLAALMHITRETAGVIECNSDLAEDGEPIPGTLDPLAVEAVAEAHELAETLASAIRKAMGER